MFAQSSESSFKPLFLCQRRRPPSLSLFKDMPLRALRYLVTILFMSIMTADALAVANKPMDEGSELLNPWKSRWDHNKLGWHKENVHPSLAKFGDKIIPNFDQSAEKCSDPPVRIFVPLCGKTVDMAFLASHPSVEHVVGVDGIRQALVEFAQEHTDLGVKTEEKGKSEDGYERFEGQDIMLLKGDFFGVTPTLAGGLVDVVWDRASMVAINPTLREDYVEVMHGLVKPGGTILLSTLERRTGTEEAVKAGPPFSISEAQVRQHYETKDWVESVTFLHEVDEMVADPESNERFKAMGVTSFFELVFEIKLK